MNIIMLLWWSLAHGNPVVPSRWQATDNLLGFRMVSLRRICPALSLYVSAGLRPEDIKHGLDGYLSAAGRTWLTSWGADQQADQARYLIGMITAARRAGWISPGP